MVVHTTLLDLHVDPSLISGAGDASSIQSTVELILRKYGYEKQVNVDVPIGFLAVFKNNAASSHLTARCHKDGLLSIMVEEFATEGATPVFNLDVSKKLEDELRDGLNLTKTKRYPSVKRGTLIDQYVSTSDERLVEYDFDKIVYEEDSKFQNIKILHSPSFGNMLILDDLQNLGESDLPYTHTLMCKGEISYTDKEALILGGGDGALLYELLKENPKWVVMVEIDKMVMDACKTYMRSVCGDCLDTYKGKNYEILVDDCVKIMENYINESRTFDIVFGDLTDIPISTSPNEEFWSFLFKIIELSLKLLKPGGRYLMHGNGVNATLALSTFEARLQKMSVPIHFKKRSSYVPSFMETWVFYEIWKTSPKMNGTTLNNCV